MNFKWDCHIRILENALLSISTYMCCILACWPVENYVFKQSLKLRTILLDFNISDILRYFLMLSLKPLKPQ